MKNNLISLCSVVWIRLSAVQLSSHVVVLFWLMQYLTQFHQTQYNEMNIPECSLWASSEWWRFNGTCLRFSSYKRHFIRKSFAIFIHWKKTPFEGIYKLKQSKNKWWKFTMNWMVATSVWKLFHWNTILL